MNRLLSLTVLLTLSPHFAMAHEGHSHSPSPQAQKKIIRLNTEPPKVHFVVQRRVEEPERPELAKLFDPFAEKVKVRFDRDFLHVESDGMPDHPMMIGITAWQQQVPLPQSYTGNNAWRIPLHPVPAMTPLSAKKNFFRGAIALAANGVPIFNPIKNDGKPHHDDAAQQATAGDLIRYVLGLPLSVAVVGMSSLDQLRENVAAARLTPFDAEHRRALEARMNGSPSGNPRP